VDAACLDASPVVIHRVMVASLSCVVDSRDNSLRSDSSTLTSSESMAGSTCSAYGRLRTHIFTFAAGNRRTASSSTHSALHRMTYSRRGETKQVRQLPRTRRNHMTTSFFGVCPLVVSRSWPVSMHQPRVIGTLETRHAQGQY
jgi:hypothetical protein